MRPVSRADALARDLNNAKHQLDDVKGKIAIEQENLTNVWAQVEEAKKDLRLLEVRKSDLDQNLQDSARLKQEITDLTVKVDGLKKDIEELTLKRDGLYTDISSLERELKRSRKNKRDAEDSTAVLGNTEKSTKERLGKRKAEIAKLQKEESDLEASIEALTETNNALEKETKARQKEKEDLETGKKELKEAIELNNQREVYIKARYEQLGVKYD